MGGIAMMHASQRPLARGSLSRRSLAWDSHRSLTRGWPSALSPSQVGVFRELLLAQDSEGHGRNVAFVCQRGCNRSGTMAVAYCAMLSGQPVEARAGRT